MAVRIGVDTGGTFTDVCLAGDDGEIATVKLSSSPGDPSEAIVEGIGEILRQEDTSPDTVSRVSHGTTVATNALLEGRGVRTGIVTTDGFRDLLELGRQTRPALYDLQTDKPPPLVRRSLRFEVPERVMANGDVMRPLDREAVRRAVRQLKAAGVESVAVCFLYSYLRPEHEDAVGEIIEEEFPEAYTSLSHEVLAEFREYERLSTTVVNGFVGPIMSRYMRRLHGRLESEGVGVEPYITQSNGGIISLEVASETPVRTVLSGPAAGITGAAAVGDAAGIGDLITFDMGGTSTDVALVVGGESAVRMDREVSGYPIRMPMLDINTVGAGGGSLARVDSGGHLKVGPESAGAEPGPACYGRGGEQPTVTDANVALGVLSRESLLGGRMPIDASAADRSVDTLADDLGLGREEVAQGIVDLATVSMARAIRVVTVQRGRDPRDYAIVAFGGAGPLHAARLARELEVPRVLVPRTPGLLSAFGLLVADLKTDFSRTRISELTEEALPEINGRFDELVDEAEEWFAREEIPQDRRQTRRIADLRYAGQNYELPLEMPDRVLATADLPDLLSRFHEEHERVYGHAAPDEPVQCVTLRVEATGSVPKPRLPRIEKADAGSAKIGVRRAYLPEAGGWCDADLYDRAGLGAGAEVAGPAILEQMDTTTLVPPGWQAETDGYGNILMTEEGR